MGYEVETRVVGPFEVMEAAYTGGAAGGTLDRGIVARTKDGRRVVIGEVWAAGVGKGGVKIRLHATAVADSLVHVANAHDILHAALVKAEDALAIKASLRAPEQARVQAALEAVRTALSAARPAPAERDS
jgi:hypothetical protein